MTLTSLSLLLGCCALQAEDRMNNSSTTQSTQKLQTGTATAQADKNDQIDMKKLSEAFGHFIGRNLQSPGLSFELESIIKGIREGASGSPAPLSDKEYEDMMAAVQERAFKEMSTTNLKSANDFMSKNSQVSGVIEVVPTKLQYTILTEGTGPTVEAHSSPKIHYTGKYQDGTVFGTSEEMGGPITIPLDQTIPGFSKGIVGMKEGEKRRLFVHPDLGYGTTGQLPPNELLIFDIEMVKANAEPDAKGQSSGLRPDDMDDDYDDDDEDDQDQDQNNHQMNSQTNTMRSQGQATPATSAGQTQTQTQMRR